MNFFLLIFVISLNCQAAFTTCGKYEIKGTLYRENGSFYILANEKTKSEYKINIPMSAWPTVAPYVNFPVDIIGQISRKIEGYSGALNEVESISRDFPDYLGEAFSDGLLIIKKSECK